MFNIPVLYIVFNRLDTVQKTFLKIKEIQPRELFISADGPRKEKEGENEKCLEVRKWIIDNIDWNCKVHTLFRDENVGCKYGVSGAIKWFFDQVDKGIVLEDDILVNTSFFHYCELMLNTYENNSDIGFISGCTFMKFLKGDENDYFLSSVAGVWGWASWKRVIKNYDVDKSSLSNKKDFDIKNYTFVNNKAAKLYVQRSIESAKGKINTWDYQMCDYLSSNKFKVIYPKKSLVRNIGFISDSTHTNAIPNYYIDVSYDYNFQNIITPEFNKYYANKYEKTIFIPLKNKIIIVLAKNKLLRKIYHMIKGK